MTRGLVQRAGRVYTRPVRWSSILIHMRRLGVALFTVVLLAAASRRDACAQTVERTFALASPAELEAHGVKVEAVTYRGRAAVRLTELPGNVRTAVAILKGTSFKDGTIAAELAGLPAAGAAEAARGFVGIAFRVNGDRFEWSTTSSWARRKARSRSGSVPARKRTSPA